MKTYKDYINENANDIYNVFKKNLAYNYKPKGQWLVPYYRKGTLGFFILFIESKQNGKTFFKVHSLGQKYIPDNINDFFSSKSMPYEVLAKINEDILIPADDKDAPNAIISIIQYCKQNYKDASNSARFIERKLVTNFS